VNGLVGGGGGGSAGATHGSTVVGSSKPNRRWRTHDDFWPEMENAQWSGGLVSRRRWWVHCGVEERRWRERGRERFGGKIGFGDKKWV
jgi:hypothetical protein